MLLTHQDHESLRDCLCALQRFALETILTQRERKTSLQLASITEETPADTIYAIDEISDAAILRWFAENWPSKWPVELIMEGFEGKPLQFPEHVTSEETLLKCIIDPIDGTRGLMYDKRPAWILSGIAKQKGETNSLDDIIVAAMTEVPTTRQWRADQVSSIKGKGIKATTFDVRDAFHNRPVKLSPSTDKEVHHAFATISRFFPAASTLLSQCEERLWEILYSTPQSPSPLIFNDQYISSGGQFYEILSGKDSFVADLRPLAFKKLGIESNLACHPYDVCTALILQEAGCIVEAPDGSPLKPPLNTKTPVAFTAYANQALADHIRPALQQVIKELL